MEKDDEFTKEYLKGKLNIGVKIQIGKNYASQSIYFKEGQILELVEGFFEHDNGLYDVIQTAPSIYDEQNKDYDSIYHLFGNDLSGFMDCRIVQKDNSVSYRH